MRTRLYLLLVCFSVSVSAPAAAVPIGFTGTVSDGTWDEVADRGTSGTLGGGVPGAVWDLSFDLGVGVTDLGSVVIDLGLDLYDHNFTVEINGTEIVPIDLTNPAAFTPGVATPWVPSSLPSPLPRLVMSFSATGVSFLGTPTTAAPALVPVVYAQTTGVPAFLDGINTLRFTMVNDVGPDSSDWGISGSALLLVPEPSTGLLVAFGGLLLARRRTRG